MARIPRRLTVLSDHSVHKVWRGHNREWNLGTNEQKAAYLDFLNQDLESKKYESGAELQALTLMSNHTHEISRVLVPQAYSNHMRRHHGRYGAYFNRMNERCGKVAQDRPHTTLLQDDQHEREAVFYVHANPMRANMQDADRYYWSTHKLYAFGKREPWMRNIHFPKWYLNLGKNMSQRQKVYRKLFALYLKEKGHCRQPFLKQHFFGTESWCQELNRPLKQWREDRKPPP